jgi:lipoate-protein ligase A
VKSDIQGALPIRFRFFESQSNVVVLANSNKAESEVNKELCQKDIIPILKRKGGGGTVVLTRGCLILTFAAYMKELYNNKEYFHLINSLWIEALESKGIQGLEERGISDIVYKGKKLCGTSLFRKRNLLVYQGSLLVHPDLEFISRYLKHPTREPDYRKKREHLSFMTSLQEMGYSQSCDDLKVHCENFFHTYIEKKMGSHLLV